MWAASPEVLDMVWANFVRSHERSNMAAFRLLREENEQQRNRATDQQCEHHPST
jgi:hypothetical protein